MKAIMVMYDSLNRHFLPNYGNELTKMPNFRRLGEKCVTFDNSYVGSLPCMPARRELHTGRLNFLHRGWCPLEPFDDSMPEILKKNGIYTHLVSDHQHYWEDGGATYHTRYNSWECSRGQEGDPWKADLKVRAEDHPGSFGPFPKDPIGYNMRRQDCANRRHIKEEKDFHRLRPFPTVLRFSGIIRIATTGFSRLRPLTPMNLFSRLKSTRNYTGRTGNQQLLLIGLPTALLRRIKRWFPECGINTGLC